MGRLTVVAATGLSTASVGIHVVGRNEVYSERKKDPVSFWSQFVGVRGVF